ncbi:MAG: ABC transporter permease [Gemmatimonadota bacterium]
MTLGMSWLDWKLGGRMLVKYPGLSVIGGLALAAAIGLGAGWFEVTRQLTKPRLPLADGDRIVRIDNWDAAASRVESRSLYDFQLWREQLTSIDEFGAYRSLERNLITPDGSAYPVTVAEISASAFPLTRVPPLLGRTLLEADTEPGATDVVVIGYDVWQRRFDADREVIGRTVRLGRTPATIVGVMPEGFRFPISHQLWVPLRLTSAAPREGLGINVFGRLTDGATLESAQAELTAIGQRMAATNPTTHAQLRPRVSLYAAPALGDRQIAGLVRVSNILAWLILAAACANVATLMFARNATREAEIVVRNALGAARARVLMQLFVEAFVLCAVAALVGLIAIDFALSYGIRLWPDPNLQLPFWWEFRVRPSTVVYGAILAFSGALLVGLLPALKATGPRVQLALTSMASGSTSMQFGGLWSVMIVLQVMFASLCLPIALGIAFDVLRERPPPAYPLHEYLTFRPELDRDATITAAGAFRIEEYRAHLLKVYDELKRRLESEPSVVAVTFADNLPGMGYLSSQLEAQRGTSAPFVVAADIPGDRAWTADVDIAFFDAFRIPLVAGRAFHAGDANAANAVIINETLARNIGGNALGSRIRYAGRDAGEQANPWYEVVGIVRNRAIEDADFMYVPVSAAAVSPLVVGIHVRGDAAALAPRLRALATQVEPGLRLYDLVPLDEFGRREGLAVTRATIAIVVITMLVMALSAAGLYSLMSVAVTRRTREIGIRLAIGASPRAVLAAVFARAAVQVGIGIVLGNALLPPVMTALGQAELTVGEVLPQMLAASAAMLLVGLVACGVPARRALRVQPTEAVKYAG